MPYSQKMIGWLREERESLIHRIDVFATGKAQFRENRDGRMVDTTGEQLRNMHRQLAELDAFLAEVGADIGV